MPTTLKGIDALSERQKEILHLTAQHHQAKEIARLLHISENTVKTHMGEARRRLGGITTKQAIRLLLAQEETRSLPLEGGDLKEVIPPGAESMPAWFHEQALHTQRRSHPDRLHPTAEDMADDDITLQTPEYSFRYSTGAVGEPSRSGRSAHGDSSSHGILDGRWVAFRRRLKTLPAIQVIGLIVIAAIGLALIAGMLVATLLGMVEVVHKLTIYAGWKS